MKTKRVFVLLSIAELAFAFNGCSNHSSPTDAGTAALGNDDTALSLNYESNGGSERIVIANRAAGNITVIDVATDQVIGTYDLPDSSGLAEPMYVVWSPAANRVFVGDRGNNSVVAFNADDFSVEGSVSAGAGVFHMYADLRGAKQLWVNNDVDNTCTVIDPVNLTVIATVPIPADLVALGGKPHDVVVEPKGRFAYVTVTDVTGNNDYVVQFDTQTFQEIGRAAVGNDPHVAVSPNSKKLFVPCQGSGIVYVFKLRDLSEIAQITAPNAHGAALSLSGNVFYATNIADDGVPGLYTIDTDKHAVRGTTDTPVITPHNIALAGYSSANGSPGKLYITHSGGTANQVTVYDVSSKIPTYVTTVIADLNPFGLAYIR